MASNNSGGSDRVSREDSSLDKQNVPVVDDATTVKAVATVDDTTKDESIQDSPSNGSVDAEKKTTSNVDDSVDQISNLGLHPLDTGDIKGEAAPDIGDIVNEELIPEAPSPDPANIGETVPKTDDAVSKDPILESPSPEATNIEEAFPMNDDAANNDSIPEPSSLDPTDIEEGKDSYHPGGFHPVYIGDLYADRYKILEKIGYGAYSTVWLVQDLKATDEKQKFRALKVLSAMAYDTPGKTVFEREILTHLRNGDQTKPGYKYICHLVDDFQHEGPNGNHVCLVFEIMGETLRSFGSWFKDNQIPTDVMTKFTTQLLLALDYAHKHNVIHTDIRPENILVKFLDLSRIESEFLPLLTLPEQDRNADQYVPVMSSSLQQFYFSQEHGDRVAEVFEIALGDWGVASWTTNHLCTIIQPCIYRAPEVMINSPWDTTTDLWNFGPVLLELHLARQMFYGKVTQHESYDPKLHLYEMVDFFGPFPKELLAKGNQDIVKECFDDEGKIEGYSQLGSRSSLESGPWMEGLNEKEREIFGSFLRAMMKIDPAERPSIKELLRHPWLHADDVASQL